MSVLLLVGSSIFFGVEFTDSGFIQGLAWALYSGGELYEDIDYVRPPLTPFLWHFVFWTGVTDGQEVFFRSLVTIEKASIGLMIATICRRQGHTSQNASFVGVISFIFLVHHLPAMPWHTVDGLFFLTLAVFLFCERWINLALIAAILAAACKQSFVFFTPILFFFIVLDRRSRSFKSLLTNVTVLIVTLLCFFYFFNIQDMLASWRSGQTVNTLIRVAILPHFQLAWPHIPVILGAVAAYLTFRKRGQLAVVLLFALYIPLASITVAAAKFYLHGDFVFSLPPRNTTHLFFVFVTGSFLRAAVTHGLARAVHDDRFRLAFMLLAGSWMSTISWGFNNYIFSFGLLVAVWALVNSAKMVIPTRLATSLLLLMCVAFSAMKLVTPYRTSGLLSDKQVQVQSGAYRNIFVSELEFQRLEAVRRIFDSPGCAEIFPSVPQAHMTQGRVSALPAGWMLEVEYPSHPQTHDILARHSCRLFIERHQGAIGWSSQHQKAAGLDLKGLGSCLVEHDAHFWMIDFASCDMSPDTKTR